MFVIVVCLLAFGILFDPIKAQSANPTGYLVGKYTEYASCEGDTTARSAIALNRCVFTGPIGVPYVNTFAKYYINPTNNNQVMSQIYFDEFCTQPAGLFTIDLNACTTSGAAVYFTFSQPIPTLNGGYITLSTYDYEGTETVNCPTNSTLLTRYLFTSHCQYDCSVSAEYPSSSCIWSGCTPHSSAGDIAILAGYSELYCPAADFSTSAAVVSNCRYAVNCVDQPAPSKPLKTPAVIGITFAATFVGCCLIFTALHLWLVRRAAAQAAASPGLTTKLVDSNSKA